jgi:hypothetical protein
MLCSELSLDLFRQQDAYVQRFFGLAVLTTGCMQCCQRLFFAACCVDNRRHMFQRLFFLVVWLTTGCTCFEWW